MLINGNAKANDISPNNDVQIITSVHRSDVQNAKQGLSIGKCGNSSKFFQDDINKRLLFFGKGEIHIVDQLRLLSETWDKNSIESIRIWPGIDSIGDRMFAGMTNLKTVSISTTVSKIGSKVFDSCNSLKKIEFTGSQIECSDDVFGLAIIKLKSIAIISYSEFRIK